MSGDGAHRVKYEIVKPCHQCPFRRGEGAVRLRARRIAQVCDSTGHDGRTFACHKTVDYDREDDDETFPSTDGQQHCAGALIFGLKHDGPHQMGRIAGRLGMWDPRRLKPHFDEVFDDIDEMMATAVDRRR